MSLQTTKLNNYIKLLYIFSLILFCGSVLAKFYLSNTLSVKNVELQSKLEQKASLEKDLLLLSDKDTQLSSVKYIDTKARALGFVDMQEGLLSIDTSAQSQVAVATTTR
jgi:hypothetical protein